MPFPVRSAPDCAAAELYLKALALAIPALSRNTQSGFVVDSLRITVNSYSWNGGKRTVGSAESVREFLVRANGGVRSDAV
jgi:hypothetical protein